MDANKRLKPMWVQQTLRGGALGANQMQELNTYLAARLAEQTVAQRMFIDAGDVAVLAQRLVKRMLHQPGKQQTKAMRARDKAYDQLQEAAENAEKEGDAEPADARTAESAEPTAGVRLLHRLHRAKGSRPEIKQLGQEGLVGAAVARRAKRAV